MRYPFLYASESEILEFAANHPLAPYNANQAREFLRELVSGPECVYDMWEEGRRVLLAVAIDTCDNPSNSADLAFVACDAARTSLPTIQACLKQAEQQLRRGARKGINVTTHIHSPIAENLLNENGYQLSYQTQIMKRRGQPALETPALPPNSAWVSVNESNVDQYYQAVRLFFAENPETSVPEREIFRARALAQKIPAHLLVQGTQPLALARVEAISASEGDIVTVARHPAHRGAGLGGLALKRAMDFLSQQGIDRLCLQVHSSNQRAIALYEKFGFETCDRFMIFQKVF